MTYVFTMIYKENRRFILFCVRDQAKIQLATLNQSVILTTLGNIKQSRGNCVNRV